MVVCGSGRVGLGVATLASQASATAFADALEIHGALKATRVSASQPWPVVEPQSHSIRLAVENVLLSRAKRARWGLGDVTGPDPIPTAGTTKVTMIVFGRNHPHSFRNRRRSNPANPS
jgi:hypothetical protein